jgi:hypothetical protein
MMGFMARAGLYLFVFPNIADMPRGVPTDNRQGGAPNVQGDIYVRSTPRRRSVSRTSRIKAWGYLQWSVASYPDILDIVNQNMHDYIGALISIEAFTAGSATARLYSIDPDSEQGVQAG